MHFMPIPPSYVQYESSLRGYQVAHLSAVRSLCTCANISNPTMNFFTWQIKADNTSHTGYLASA